LNILTGSKNLYELVAELGAELGSLYKGSRHDKSNILEFMDSNEWFGLKCVMKDLAPRIDNKSISKIREPLCLWLLAYKKPDREKTTILLERFNGIYPDLCRLYKKFLNERGLWDAGASWKLLDFLFAGIDKDITAHNEQDIENLVLNVNANATKVAAGFFADFIEYVNKNGTLLSRWTYAFGTRTAPERINSAYSLPDFSVMAYCVFNDEMWKKQKLIEKAVRNKTYADLWLFIALHFICAFRKGDMERIPAPSLPYSTDVIFTKVLSGTFDKQEAAALVEEMTLRFNMKSMKPSKTAKHGNVPTLKLFVPESFIVPLGIIIALVLAHHPEIRVGDSFVKPSDNLENIRKFFGKHFTDAIGNRRFSSRRSNKSYLQGIELSGSDEPGKPKGYMLAALARSHKSGIGKFAETTEIYLKDARFSGYNPEFIIRQMFERGIFSFIPAVLLEIYAGTEYVKLPVISQTKLIGVLGMTASQIDGLIETVDRALIKSRNAVASVIKNPAHMQTNVADMLQNIASGAACGKQDGCLCLMTSAGLACPYPERKSCICCGYEIYTKTVMRGIMREYKRLMLAKETAEPDEARRYGLILEQAILPIAKEMLSAANLLYPEADTNGLLDIMVTEADLYGDDDGSRDSGRFMQPVHTGS
jgi:hypothetical protein